MTAVFYVRIPVPPVGHLLGLYPMPLPLGCGNWSVHSRTAGGSEAFPQHAETMAQHSGDQVSLHVRRLHDAPDIRVLSPRLCHSVVLQ